MAGMAALHNQAFCVCIMSIILYLGEMAILVYLI